MSPAQPQAALSGSALVVSGEVTALTVLGLRQQGEGLIRQAGGDLTVDLDGLVTAHSVVLSMVLCWQRLASSLGIALTFRGVSDRLASLAALSNLDSQLAGFSPQ